MLGEDAGRYDQKIDVTAPRIEIANGKRAMEVHTDEACPQDSLHDCRQ
jgi:hypothetical protein